MSEFQKKKLTTAKDLLYDGLIWDADLSGIETVEQAFSIGLNKHLVQLIKKKNQPNAIYKQYVPSLEELNILPPELDDPIGDNAHSPVKGIVHRYPDRALFKVVNVCAVYCRFCFRRELLQDNADVLKIAEYEEAIDYIKANKNIWEVILTGGDPLVLSPRKMAFILDELSHIRHLEVVRIHTRLPIADPEKMTDAYIQTIKDNCKKPVYMVLHINHADEIDTRVKNRLKALHEAGINLLSQSVLLNGINNDAKILEQLFRKLISLNVKPYYLHHPDMAKGTSHFRLPLKEGLSIYRKLLGNISGICQPSYMLDIPGGYGKIPVNATYVQEISNGTYIVEDYQGNKHYYYDDHAVDTRAAND